MKRRLAQSLIGSAILLATAFAPSAAAPGASAHGGYAGYGCSGWTQPAWNYVVQDCYAGQQSYPYVLIFHDYQGIAAPSDYYSWERLY